jgi:hypothetical protein
MILDRPTLFSDTRPLGNLIRPSKTALVAAVKALLPDITGIELDQVVDRTLRGIPAQSNAADVDRDIRAAAIFVVDTIRTDRRRRTYRPCKNPSTMLPRPSPNDAELPSRFF